MNTKDFKKFMLYTLPYLWGMFWMIAGLQHSVGSDLPIFKHVGIVSQYVVESWPPMWMQLCMVWGNIVYAASGCFCNTAPDDEHQPTKKERMVYQYFFAGIYFCLDIISLVYFTKIVVMITTVQMMSQFIIYEKKDKVNATAETIPVALEFKSTSPTAIPLGDINI